jgi:hypothetical protein
MGVGTPAFKNMADHIFTDTSRMQMHGIRVTESRTGNARKLASRKGDTAHWAVGTASRSTDLQASIVAYA